MDDEGLADVVVLDVDGTLVDTTYLHVRTWVEAFASVGVEVQHWRVHRTIGMGGDRLVTAVAGEDAERQLGDRVRDEQLARLTALVDQVRAVPGAAELMAELRRRGVRVTVASSGSAEQTDRLLSIAGGDDLVQERTTSADVERSKPSPDAIDVVLERVGGSRALVVGDAAYDMQAAREHDHRAVGVRSGGISEAELRDAGAEQVYDDVADVLAHLDALPIRVGGSTTSPG